jgi:cytochrome c oxidase subunit 4
MTAAAAPTAHEETVHGTGHQHPSDLQYVWVAIFLAVVTGAEVAMSYIDVTNAVYIPVLLVMMIVKFSVVVLWFMHLRFDSRLFRRLFLSGIVLAVGVYMAFLLSMQYFGDDTTSTVKTTGALAPVASQVS